MNTLTLAVDGYGTQPTSWIPVTCFGRTAELVAEYTDKGHLVAIEGRITSGKYTNDAGETIFTLDVIDVIDIIESSSSTGPRPPRPRPDYETEAAFMATIAASGPTGGRGSGPNNPRILLTSDSTIPDFGRLGPKTVTPPSSY